MATKSYCTVKKGNVGWVTTRIVKLTNGNFGEIFLTLITNKYALFSYVWKGKVSVVVDLEAT